MAQSTHQYRPPMTRPRRALLRRALQVGISEFSVMQEFNITRATLGRVIDNFYNDNVEEDAYYLDTSNLKVTSSPKVHKRVTIMPGMSTASHVRPLRQAKRKVLAEKTRALSKTRRDDQESNGPAIVLISLSHSRLSNATPQSQSFTTINAASATADAVRPFLRQMAKFDKLKICTRKDLLVLSEHVKDPICCQSLQTSFKLPLTEWIVLVKALLDYAEVDDN
ncbi:uncharacterized protein EV420DRAFT_1514888 [Desarmillaria tabescens]|uniref:Uncharacterized protein n=1 Tax=Armillaria tabescens TaxID=1929756 RepID=A0AA39TT19_ARMTA|nr:uncharacterized protein EV420DRAFT_1514888 [Desarmillaria tabescens]KAK0465553.1 hypothetical protein EV420DRAFT_1514888 [Desarmillaria tabescens]